VPPQHRVLVPEHEQFSILGQVSAEYQDGEAQYSANQQIDNREQHPASQPSPSQARRRKRWSAMQLSIRAAGDLEVPAGQRMEPVRHPDTSVPVIWIGCR
jgi:hypothetical protein